MRPAPLAPLAIVLLAVAALAGCGGAPAPSGGGGGGSQHPPALHLTAASNGTTVSAAVGQQVDVALQGVQWTFDPPRPATTLHPVSGPTAVPSHCTPVGSGCGTSSESFTATTSGTTVLSAHRTTCGEAMACTGRNGAWQVTLVVR